MAGELLVIIASQPALGVRLHFQREVSDATALIGTMIVILAIGIFVDLVIFGRVERRIRERRGLTAGPESGARVRRRSLRLVAGLAASPDPAQGDPGVRVGARAFLTSGGSRSWTR